MPGWGKCIVQTHSASTGGEEDSLVSVLQAKCRIECVKWRTWDVENDSLVILLETKGEDSGLVGIVQHKCFKVLIFLWRLKVYIPRNTILGTINNFAWFTFTDTWQHFSGTLVWHDLATPSDIAKEQECVSTWNHTFTAMTCVGWVDKAFLSELHIKKLQFLKVK